MVSSNSPKKRIRRRSKWIRLFFGRILGYQKSFRYYLTFTASTYLTLHTHFVLEFYIKWIIFCMLSMDLETHAIFIVYYRVNFSIIVKILETFKMWCFTIRNTMKYQWCFLSPNAFLVKEKLPSKSVVTGANKFSFLGCGSAN